MDTQAAVDFVRNWYSGVRFPLRLTSPSFGRFITSYSLVEFVEKGLFRKAGIRLDDKQTAYTDGKTVNLPFWYFDEDSYRLFGPPEDAPFFALACINGSLIHEYRHVLEMHRWLEKNPGYELHAMLRQWKYYPKRDSEANENLMDLLFNLVEDLYIESLERYTPLGKFLQIKNDILLPEHQMDEQYEYVATTPEFGVQQVINTLIFLKNERLRNVSHDLWGSFPWFPEARDILLAAATATPSPLDFRIEVTWNLYFCLKRNIGEKALKKQSNNLAVVEQFESGERPTSIYSSFEAKHERKLSRRDKDQTATVMSILEEEGEPAPEKFSPEGAKAFKLHVITTLAPGEKRNERWQFQNLDFFLRYFTGRGKADPAKIPCNTMRLEDNEDVVRGDIYTDHLTNMIPVVPELAGLKEAIKFRDRTFLPDAPVTSGPVLLSHRLSRYQYDDHLFSHRTRITKTDPETIVVLDMSGSMRTSVRFMGKSVGLAQLVMAVGKRIHEALAGQRHLVIGFTTDCNPVEDYNETPIIVKIAGYGMGYQSSIPNPFNSALNVDYGNNYDHVAIREAGKMFTGRKTHRFVLVVSDGNPVSIHYADREEGVNLTKQEVATLTDLGIITVAICLTDEALNSCREIYGGENAVDARNLNDFPRLVNETLTRLQKGYTLT